MISKCILFNLNGVARVLKGSPSLLNKEINLRTCAEVGFIGHY